MSQPDNAGEGQAHNALTPSGGMDTPSHMDNPGRNNSPNQNGFSPNGKDKNTSDDPDRASKLDRGSAQVINGNSDEVVQNRVVIKMASGQSAQFDVDSRMAAAIKARGDHKALIFYSSDGKDVTSVSAIGERCHGQVVGTSGNSILFRTDDGQTRILSFGAAGATQGRLGAPVCRARGASDAPGERHHHALDFQMVYVLGGWVDFEYDGVGRVRLEPGSSVVQPPGIRHTELAHSDDLEMLEITLPAEFPTATD